MIDQQRTLVVVPTDEELQHLVSALHEAGAPARPSVCGRLSTFDVEVLAMVVAPGGLGKTQFAVQTQYLLGAGVWHLVVCAGAAGALCDDVAIGDVVIATETVEHDIRKVSRRLMPRFAGDEKILNACRGTNRIARGVRVHYGVIASQRRRPTGLRCKPERCGDERRTSRCRPVEHDADRARLDRRAMQSRRI